MGIQEAAATETGAKNDPLAEIIEPVERIEQQAGGSLFDGSGGYYESKIEPRDVTQRTKNDHKRAWRQWREYMENEGRNPSCASPKHAKGWVRSLLDGGNHPETVKAKVRRIESVYAWYADKSVFPHPANVNPIAEAKDHFENRWHNWGTNEENGGRGERGDTPFIPTNDLRSIIGEITNLRDRAIVVAQLKTGLRANELANIRLEELHIEHAELSTYYPEIGTADGLHVRGELQKNALYVPPRENNARAVEGRSGNKSSNPRIVPLDAEARRVLLEYLRLRPCPEDRADDNGWLFLSQNQEKIDGKAVTNIWKRSFWNAAEEHGIERPNMLSSHYARKRFTTYWKAEKNVLSREQVQYLRGDVIGGNESGSHGGKEPIDAYLDAFYPKIEPVFRENPYSLGIV